jgi:ribokinase
MLVYNKRADHNELALLLYTNMNQIANSTIHYLRKTRKKMGNCVVVLGSLITDLVARAPRMPYAGESLIGDEFAIFLGGKGINQAIAAKRLGAEVTLVGRVGSDSFGDDFFPVLKQEGIDDAYVERDQQNGTGVSLVIIAQDSAQNAIVANPRANLAVPATTVERALRAAQAQIQPGQRGVFLAQCETSRESYEVGLRQARALNMTTILNAAPIPREPLDDALFALVDILIVNEIEASALSQIQVTSTTSAQEAATLLLARGPQHVIVTLGAQGCLWSTRGEQGPTHQSVPPIPVRAVDTTAAGDTFCGALAASLAENMPLANAVRRASAASAITVTRRGAIAALPNAAEVADLLNTL